MLKSNLIQENPKLFEKDKSGDAGSVMRIMLGNLTTAVEYDSDKLARAKRLASIMEKDGSPLHGILIPSASLTSSYDEYLKDDGLEFRDFMDRSYEKGLVEVLASQTTAVAD